MFLTSHFRKRSFQFSIHIEFFLFFSFILVSCNLKINYSNFANDVQHIVWDEWCIWSGTKTRQIRTSWAEPVFFIVPCEWSMNFILYWNLSQYHVNSRSFSFVSNESSQGSYLALALALDLCIKNHNLSKMSYKKAKLLAKI